MYFTLLDDLRPHSDRHVHGALRRIAALRDHAGIESTLVVTGDVDGIDTAVARVRTEGDLGPTPVLHLYSALAEPDTVKRLAPALERRAEAVEVPAAKAPVIQDGDPRTYHRTEVKWFFHYFDAEGRRFLTVEKRNPETKAPLLSLFDVHSGEIVAQVGEDALVRAWVPGILGAGDAVLMIDGPRAARALQDFGRPGLATILVDHDGDTPRASTTASTVDAVVCATLEKAKDMSDRDVARVEVIAPVVEPRPRKKPAERREREVLAFVDHVPEARVDHLIRAFALALEKDKVDTLAVIGGPRCGEAFWKAKALVAELGLAATVQFLPGEDFYVERLHEAGVLASAWSFDDDGAMLVEAMARGAIPVAYDVAYGPRAVVEPGLTGYLAEDGNVEDLAEKLCEAAERSADDRMRRVAKLDVRRFAAEAIAEKWAQVFRDVTPGTSRASA